MIGWYYLHTNGTLIHKRFKSDPSDFVVKIWEFNTANRLDAWTICIEALALGANKKGVLKLKERWHLTDKDAEIYAFQIDIELGKYFDQFYAINQSFAGFGETALEAFADLKRRLV